MKKVFVTYLASLILFQGVFLNTDILYGFNELLEDYQLHKVKYGDNLTTFFSKHFGCLKEAHTKQHQKEHKQHPIQDNLGSVLQTNFTINSHIFSLNNTDFLTTKSSNFHYTDLFSSFEKQKIFQPPRIA